VRARLDRVGATDDLALVLEPAAVDAVRRLALISAEHGDDLESVGLLGWLHWHRSRALSGEAGRVELEEATRAFLPVFVGGSEEPPRQLLEVLARRALPTAFDVLTQVVTTADVALVSSAVSLMQRITDALPEGDPVRAGWLSNLGVTLQARFGLTGAPDDLDAAIMTGEAAVTASDDDHPDRVGLLTALANARRLRFSYTGRTGDLNAVMATLRHGLRVAGTSPARVGVLATMGDVLRVKFTITGALEDLDAAIEACQSAAGEVPRGHLDWAGFQASLADMHHTRFERAGSMDDLDAAVEGYRAALSVTPEEYADRPVFLSNLGNALRSRSERTGSAADLDAAIDAGRTAVQAAAGAQQRAVFLFDLGNALRDRFIRTGSLADLDAAIEIGRSGLVITDADHQNRPVLLAGLGNALLARFERTGALADLDAGIQFFHDALAAVPAGHPRRPMYLSSLGSGLLARFDRSAAAADLDAAIEAGRAAVAAVPAGHPDRWGYLSNTAHALWTRYEQAGTAADLDAAISTGRAALDGAPSGHPGRAAVQSNLGIALRSRFERAGDVADLAAAIEAGYAAVGSTPVGHPDQARYLMSTATTLLARSGISGVPDDVQAVVDMFAQAAEHAAAPPSTRISAARAAGVLAAESQPGRSAELLGMAVGLLPEVAPRQLERSDQQHGLGGFAGLSGDAAALTLAAGAARGDTQCAARALGLLETGRAVLLSQALDTRSDLTDLRQHHPELAARFTDLRDQLDAPARQPAPASETAPDAGPAMDSPQALARDRHHLAADLNAVLEQIRDLGGFESFALPPAASELQAQAGPGPVVTFSVSTYRSDALLLTEDGVTCLPLPDFSHDRLAAEVEAFHSALPAASGREASMTERREARARLGMTLEWLWDAAAGPVLEVLGYHSEPGPDQAWPRVWWATGGLLGMLPLHAAGYHSQPPGQHHRRAVIDRVVSSYTPTVRALRYARQRASAATGSTKSLIVAMPVTPGLPPEMQLPNVTKEAAYVRSLVPDPVTLSEPDQAGDEPAAGSQGTPTRATVLEHLDNCQIAHFACHGTADLTDPSQSLLQLHDHDRDPFTVGSLSAVNLSHARLAYLSACRTAYASAATLIDEAIHLAAAFQLAGFPQVIGTLWEISDDTATESARNFYTALRTGTGGLDTARAPRALHQVVRDLRDAQPRNPSVWAGYLHAGA
jgi:hypothetical protein